MRYVEVAHLVRGDVVSVRCLSAKRELMGGLTAVGIIFLVCAAMMLLSALCARFMGRALYAPGFILVWVATMIALSGMAVTSVRRRLGRYALGSRLDADAFAPVDIDLVHRTGNRFSLTIVPGMRGYVESGRAPLPVEALVTDATRTVTFDSGARAELSLGESTFVVSGRLGRGPVATVLSRDLLKLFSRTVGVGLQLALVASLFCAVPIGHAIDDRAAHLVGARATTPWEAEKWLRIEAQAQARSLHQCFDPLPLKCQHSGYVGVGVSLTRDGEVRSNWIARSTYGAECPVDQCMKDVVSTWVFDPLPEVMRVVLPVQVLRTAKPLAATDSRLVGKTLSTNLVEARADIVDDSRAH